MRTNHPLSDPGDRARSVAATALIHLALATALLTGLKLHRERPPEDVMKAFDVMPPPVPPPVDPAPSPGIQESPAPAGRKADPSPIVAPPARIPTVQPLVAATVAGDGSASRAGAAASGSGSGSGGMGIGGGGGRAIGTKARLLSGNRGRVPRHMLKSFARDNGFAHLLLTIGETGSVTGCSVIQGTGNLTVDQALCQIMVSQSRWSPALDTTGRPISVQLRYTSVWRK